MYLVCGEALYDFFLKAAGKPGELSVSARAAGSPFSIARGLARLGQPVGLFCGVSRDALGQGLVDTLKAEGVETAYLSRNVYPTTLSLVTTTETGHPQYCFYGGGKAECHLTPEDVDKLPKSLSGLHLGSYPLVVAPAADILAGLFKKYPKSMVSLDPNIRPTVEADMSIWRHRLEALLPNVDVIKTSDEDLAHLYPCESQEDIAARWMAQGPTLMVVTGGHGAVYVYGAGRVLKTHPPQVTVEDTVGAGDTFQAALIAGILPYYHPETGFADLPHDLLSSIISECCFAAALTCTRQGADLPTRAEIRTFQESYSS